MARAVGVILGSLLCAALAQAEARPVVVILPSDPPEFWPAFEAELLASGFSPQVEYGATFPLDFESMEHASTRRNVWVGLALLPIGSGLEMWSVDRVSLQVSFRQAWYGLYREADPPEVVAVRLVELVRGTLIELDRRNEKQSPPSIEGIGPVVLRPEHPQTPPRFFLGVGGGYAFSARHVPALSFVDLSFVWSFSHRFSWVAEGGLSPVVAHLRQPEGEASIDWYRIGTALRFSVTDPNSAFQLRSGAGASLCIFSTRGSAAQDYSDRRTSVTTLIPYVDLGMRQSLTSRIGVAANASAGVSLPGVSIAFAGRQVATWGRPLWLGRLMLETSLD